MSCVVVSFSILISTGCKSRSFQEIDSKAKGISHFQDSTFIAARDEVIYFAPTSAEADPFICVYGGSFSKEINGDDLEAFLETHTPSTADNHALQYAMQAPLLPNIKYFDLDTVTPTVAQIYRTQLESLGGYDKETNSYKNLNSPIRKSALLQALKFPKKLQFKERELKTNIAKVEAMLADKELLGFSFQGVVSRFFNKLKGKKDLSNSEIKQNLNSWDVSFKRNLAYLENFEVPFCERVAQDLEPLMNEDLKVTDANASILKRLNLALIETQIFSDWENQLKKSVSCPATYGEYLSRYEPNLLAVVQKAKQSCSSGISNDPYSLNISFKVESMSEAEITKNGKLVWSLISTAQKRCMKGQTLNFCIGFDEEMADKAVQKVKLEKIMQAVHPENASKFGMRNTAELANLWKALNKRYASLK
jgi:hypothetical protein